jgi:UDP:flavonoid glycosyltransferase YjiC (YdhE family)
MRILFTACPMVGHVNTLLPLALAAQRAGHTVAFATGVDQVGRIERAGLTAWSVGPTFAEAGWPPRSPSDFVVAADKRCVDLLPRAERFRPDVVVFEETEAAGPIAALRSGARMVRHGLGIAAGGTGDGNEGGLGAFAPIFDDFGARWQVADLAGVVQSAPYLSVCPPSLAPPSLPNVRRLRPVLAPPWPGDALPPAFAALPRARTVHLTLGTVFGTTAALVTALAGLRELPVNLVVTTGGLDLPPQPAQVLVAPYLPHTLLLPYCDLVVSQGGAGILLGTIDHGLPQLVLPQAADQFANAKAVVRAGAGLALTPDAVSADRVREAAQHLLADPGYAARAAAIRAEIAAMPDADQVVSAL